MIFHSAKYRSKFWKEYRKDYLVPRTDRKNSFESNIKKKSSIMPWQPRPAHSSLVKAILRDRPISRIVRGSNFYLHQPEGKNLQARARIEFIQLLSAYSSLDRPLQAGPQLPVPSQEISSVDYKVPSPPPASAYVHLPSKHHFNFRAFTNLIAYYASTKIDPRSYTLLN